MAIDAKYFELFKEQNIFAQIHFLDNFFEILPLNQVPEQDIVQLLKNAVNDSASTYVKRASFKILCQLSLVKVITNPYCVLAILHDFLMSDEEILTTVALKYFPNFPEARNDAMVERLKELTDNPNGDIASQAYFCMGLMHLSTGISQPNLEECILSLGNAKPHFQAAQQSTENRVDAEFYLLLIEWSEALISNIAEQVGITFNRLEANLSMRKMYDFEESNLELDFLVFRLVERIGASYNIAANSRSWLEIPPQIQELFAISVEIQTIREETSSHQFIREGLLRCIFENVEARIYQLNLNSESHRLQALLAKTSDSELSRFIVNLLERLPAELDHKEENLELLALLTVEMGEQKGLQLYRKISNKAASPEVMSALKVLLNKNLNSGNGFKTGSILGQEVFHNLLEGIKIQLPNYPADKLDAFANIIEETIRFARVTFVGNEKKRFPFLFAESEGGKGQKAEEKDLQNSMIVFFEHSKIADGLSHELSKFVDGGRVDIVFKKDLITIPIELKKDLQRPDRDTLEKNYIAQAQTYTAGYDQLGILVLLELSDKSNVPPPNFKDWFNIHHLTPSSDLELKYPDIVISVVIPGNRTSPSSKSTYSR